MSERSVPALAAPPKERDNPLTRSVAGLLGLGFLLGMFALCLLTLPYTLGTSSDGVGGEASAAPRYNEGLPKAGRLPPSWIAPDADEFRRLTALLDPEQLDEIAGATGLSSEELRSVTPESGPDDAVAALQGVHPKYLLGTDFLGRSLWIRCLTGGGISLGIGIAAALISVTIGTLYGALAGYAGGKIDAVMMRIVDVLFGLPYILLVVLLAVAVDAKMDDWASQRVQAKSEQREAFVETYLSERGIAVPTEEQASEARAQAEQTLGTGELSAGAQTAINVVTLLVAIGGVSWLTMARVVRGQVLSLKNQPFVEAARAVGAPSSRIFFRHLLPNLVGPIVVYATLTVPQAILQESFLSFLGIGVNPPLPSWGNLAADGLNEVNTYKPHWWLLLFPCVLLGTTLLALNFVGEGLREALDPKRARS
ncbi:MAG: ABC transporter permease [Planctomycetota bacterium]